MSNDEICEYFASKGNPVSDIVQNTPEFFGIFIKNVRVDYTCLETYPQTTTRISAPLVVIGGELDEGVEMVDLEGWGKHVRGFGQEGDAEEGVLPEKPSSTTSSDLLIKVYPDQGHFYLSDKTILMDLGDFVVTTVRGMRNAEDVEKEAEIRGHVIAAFKKALEMAEMTEVPPEDHFFNGLGGTSLDTMVLAAHLQAALGLRISQNEFILHPTVNSLTGRVLELQRLLKNAPTLDPIENSEEWFPAAAGQVRCAAERISSEFAFLTMSSIFFN